MSTQRTKKGFLMPFWMVSLSLLLALVPFSAQAAKPKEEAPQEVKVKPLETSYTPGLGASFSIGYALSVPQGWALELPTKHHVRGGKLEVQSLHAERREEGDHVLITLRIEARLFYVGRFYLPSQKLRFTDAQGEDHEVITPPVGVLVEPSILDPASASLVPPRGPKVLKRFDWRPAAVVAGVLGGLFLGLFLVRASRKRRREREETPLPPRPSWEIALERLKRIEFREGQSAKEERVRAFLLSEAVREYLGARFGFESLELTSRELLLTLKRLRLMDRLDPFPLEELLGECDLVKFARFRAAPDLMQGFVRAAITFVEETRGPQISPGGAS